MTRGTTAYRIDRVTADCWSHGMLVPLLALFSALTVLFRPAGGDFRPSSLVNVIPVTPVKSTATTAQNPTVIRSSGIVAAPLRGAIVRNSRISSAGGSYSVNFSVRPGSSSSSGAAVSSGSSSSSSTSASFSPVSVSRPQTALTQQSTVMAAAEATRRSREFRVAETFAAWQWNRRKALPIRYHGGWVMVRFPVKIFIIYYGSWSSSEVNIVENFIMSLSNNNTTPKDSKAVSAWQWWQIATWYYMTKNGQKHAVPSQVRFQKRVFDKYSLGKKISDDLGGVWKIINQQLQMQTLPIDSSAQYLVLTSADVALGDSKTGFCGSKGYCGFHSFATDGVSYIKYAFIGNGDKCGTRCARTGGRSKTPNGKRGVDGMISIIAHEIVETATNPRIQGGWYDALGAESSDKCMTDFGSSVVVGDRYNYNMVGQNGMQWLVESNWRPVEPQGCVMTRY